MYPEGCSLPLKIKSHAVLKAKDRSKSSDILTYFESPLFWLSTIFAISFIISITWILVVTISSVGQRKEDLLINSLVERVNRDNIDEVILATSATVEGQTTAYYIQDSLKNTNVKITKLAQGLPVGGEIESLDDGTLFSAFKNRSNLNSNSG